MSEKKELNIEELEKVSGGGEFLKNTALTLSGKVSTSDAYNRIGENFFLECPGNSQGKLYATLNACYEDYILWWSYTHYKMTIISSNWHANESGYGPGKEIDVSSAQYAIYTNCSGYRY